MSVERVVCCIDFSVNAEAAFEAALEMAEKYSARLSVLHVVPPQISPPGTDMAWRVDDEPREKLVWELEAQMQEVYGERIGDRAAFELAVRDGHVSTEIMHYLEQWRADLVVVGAFGLSGMGLVIFGSVAKRVAHRAPCSVMIVRGPAAGVQGVDKS